MISSIFNPQVKQKGVALTCATKVNDSTMKIPSIIGDCRRFQQCLINLVKNALKFTKKGRIDVCANYSLNDEILSVKVTDTGAGIAEEDIPQLFTRFGKLHRTAKMNSEGIGLGLTIVKQIVEESGGTIIVHSDGINKGSCFEFSIAMKVA